MQYYSMYWLLLDQHSENFWIWANRACALGEGFVKGGSEYNMYIHIYVYIGFRGLGFTSSFYRHVG